jgi:hypothetical protein
LSFNAKNLAKIPLIFHTKANFPQKNSTKREKRHNDAQILSFSWGEYCVIAQNAVPLPP